MPAAQASPGSSLRRVVRARRIAADPVSVALLLAAPAAAELWPGVRRLPAGHGMVTVAAELSPPARTPVTAVASLRACPPRRTSTASVLRFELDGPGLPAVSGQLTVEDQPGGLRPGAAAVLELGYVLPREGLLDARRTRRLLEVSASAFLDHLAAAAEQRADAARTGTAPYRVSRSTRAAAGSPLSSSRSICSARAAAARPRPRRSSPYGGSSANPTIPATPRRSSRTAPTAFDR